MVAENSTAYWSPGRRKGSINEIRQLASGLEGIFILGTWPAAGAAAYSLGSADSTMRSCRMRWMMRLSSSLASEVIASRTR